MATPLTQLLGPVPFLWTLEAMATFQQLKTAISTALVLALPDFSIPFVVETDVSGSGMGAGLTQAGHPIAFFNKKFCPKLMGTSTYVRELATIPAAVKKWHHYLLGHHFFILTNHRSLRELMTQAVQTL